MRRERRWGRISVAAGAAAAMFSVLIALFVATNRHPSSPPTPLGVGARSPSNAGASSGCPVSPTTNPAQASGTVSRESAIEIARAYVGGQVDSARAELMTLGEYENGAGDQPLPGRSPELGALARDDLMWVVSMTGSFERGTWAVVLIDAVTGAVVGADGGGAEPPFFSDLPDRNRHERPSC